MGFEGIAYSTFKMVDFINKPEGFASEYYI